MLAVRGADPKGPAPFGVVAMAAHHAGHPPPAYGPAGLTEGDVDPRGTVADTVFMMKALDVTKKTAVLRRVRTFGSVQSGVAPGGRDTERTTDDANGIVFPTVFKNAEQGLFTWLR